MFSAVATGASAEKPSKVITVCIVHNTFLVYSNLQHLFLRNCHYHHIVGALLSFMEYFDRTQIKMGIRSRSWTLMAAVSGADEGMTCFASEVNDMQCFLFVSRTVCSWRSLDIRSLVYFHAVVVDVYLLNRESGNVRNNNQNNTYSSF